MKLLSGWWSDEINDEAFALKMERQYEARRVFQSVDVDNSGFLDKREVSALAGSLGFEKGSVELFVHLLTVEMFTTTLNRNLLSPPRSIYLYQLHAGI